VTSLRRVTCEGCGSGLGGPASQQGPRAALPPDGFVPQTPKNNRESCSAPLVFLTTCACARVRMCVLIRKLTVLYYIRTRGLQKRQHPEKSGTFLSFLFSLSRQPPGPAAR